MEVEVEDDGVEVVGCDDDDDEDIYGDLEGDIFWGPPSKKSKEDNVVNNEQYQALLKENQELKTLVKQLQRANKNYSENMSSLYLTAKNEVDKKNFIIKNLSEKLKKVTQLKSNLSVEDAEDLLKKCQEALVESQDTVTLTEISNSLKKIPEHRTKNRRKQIKFGNMSLYFFHEQGNFKRQESVDFPKSTRTEKNAEDMAESTSTEKSSGAQLNPEFGEKYCASGSQDNYSIISSVSSSDRDPSSKLNCDKEKGIPEEKRGKSPTRKKSCDENSNGREDRRNSERHSTYKRHHSPSSSAPEKYSNRKTDYSSRSHNNEHDTRAVDYHSRDSRKSYRSDDHRGSRRTTRRSTNDSKSYDGKRYTKRSRSRSR